MAELADDQTPLKERGRPRPLSTKWTQILDGRVWFMPETDFTSVSAIRSSASAAAQKRGMEASVRQVDGGVLIQGHTKASGGRAGARAREDVARAAKAAERARRADLELMDGPPAPTHELPGGRDAD